MESCGPMIGEVASTQCATRFRSPERCWRSGAGSCAAIMIRKTIAAAAIVTCCGFAAFSLQFLSSINTGHARLAEQLAPAEPAPPRLARHVVLVIFDGLRDDVSRDLPFLTRLRAIG